VTAGVYLIIRLAPLGDRRGGLSAIGLVGALTIIMASASAIIETDLKKIVALSTLSQLGVIVLRLSLRAPHVAFFHLVVHAFFKALLFVVTGNLIHASCDYQDLRRIGGSVPSLPVTQATVITTKISLCALPFFSAFFSKELVLEGLGRGAQGPALVYLLMGLGAVITGLYSVRFVVFRVKAYSGPALVWKEDPDLLILVSILILFLPRVLAGKAL